MVCLYKLTPFFHDALIYHNSKLTVDAQSAAMFSKKLDGNVHPYYTILPNHNYVVPPNDHSYHPQMMLNKS